MIAIDLGSNTLRCIVYDCNTKEWGLDFEAVVRTAEGLHVSNRISENALQRVLFALHQADEKLDFSMHTIIAYTTEAMRRATNSKEVLEKIFQHTAIDFQIINGEQEAFFTAKAVRNRLNILNLPSTSYVLTDIGGGSTEIIFSQDERFISKSFDLGIVTLYESSMDVQSIEKNLETALEPIREYVNSYYKQFGKPEFFVQTAGTPTTLAAFLQGMTYFTYNSSKINGFLLEKRDCSRVLSQFLAMSEEERILYVGVGREGLILAGIMIVMKLYELLDYDQAVVIDDGLREGIALSYCKNNESIIK